MAKKKATTTKKASSKKTTAKKAVAKKKTTKKAAPKKTSAKKAASKKTVAKKATTKKSAPKRTVLGLNPQERWNKIAEAAYLKAEKRGFVAGYEFTDWIEAEKEVAKKFGK